MSQLGSLDKKAICIFNTLSGINVASETSKQDIREADAIYISPHHSISDKAKAILMISKIRLDLENCYGIKKLKEDLDFTGRRVVAIYAPNGSMKSSFAQTFLDLSKGDITKDRYFPTRATKRKITDQAIVIYLQMWFCLSDHMTKNSNHPRKYLFCSLITIKEKSTKQFIRT